MRSSLVKMHFYAPTRRSFLLQTATSLLVTGAAAQPVPDKLIVLTFDDAVKSHRTFVALRRVVLRNPPLDG